MGRSGGAPLRRAAGPRHHGGDPSGVGACTFGRYAGALAPRLCCQYGDRHAEPEVHRNVLRYGTQVAKNASMAKPILAVTLRNSGRDYRLGYYVATQSGFTASAAVSPGKARLGSLSVTV